MSKPRLDHLKDRHLKLLVLLSDERQLGKAALRLGISQPAASKTLVDIEERVGCALFIRGPHETTPTEQGEIVVGYARHCLGETSRVAAELEAFNLRKTKVLRIGMLASSAMTIVPKVVSRLVQDDPTVEVSLEEGILTHLVEKLRSSEVDLVIGRIDIAVPQEEFEEVFLFDEPLSIVCRREHPILRADTVRMQDALGYAWILPLRTTLLRQKVNEIFRAHSLPVPRQAIESNSIVANLAIMQSSDRLSAMSGSTANRWIEQGLLERVPVDVQVYPGSIGVVLRKSETHLAAVSKFMGIVRALFVNQ